MGANLNNLGTVYSALSQYPKAIEVTQRAAKAYEDAGYLKGMARALGNLGQIYVQLSDYPSALKYFQKSFKILGQLGINSSYVAALSNMGHIYSNLGDNVKSLEYQKKALLIATQLEEKDSHVILYAIGLEYQKLKQYDEASKYYFQAIKVLEELNNLKGLPFIYNNLGYLNYELGKFEYAWECYNKGLNFAQKIKHIGAVALLHLSMGELLRDAPIPSFFH